MSHVAYWNNQEVEFESLEISAHDRSFYFADAVYEVIRVYDGKLWLFDEHLQRLKRSLEIVRICIKIDDIEGQVQKSISKNQIQDGFAYIQISRGAAPRTHSFPPNTQPNVLIYSKQFSADPFGAFRTNGIKAVTQADIRWKRRDVKSVNLLANCLAKQIADEAGAQEAILFEEDGTITEATSNNVFIVSNGKISTRAASNLILNGITRLHVISLAKRLGLVLEEEIFTLQELFLAEEVFITGSFAEVLGVVEIDGKKIGDGKVGKVTNLLVRAFEDSKVSIF